MDILIPSLIIQIPKVQVDYSGAYDYPAQFYKMEKLKFIIKSHILISGHQYQK